MRFLRSSLYSQPGHEPTTTVVAESDVIDTLESIREHNVPGTLIVHEIFDMPDDTEIEAATIEALRRRDANGLVEQNMAILYYWTIMSWRPLVDGGVVMMANPMPLAAEQIATVFEQLAQHPDYADYGVVGRAEDGRAVELRDSQITIEGGG